MLGSLRGRRLIKTEVGYRKHNLDLCRLTKINLVRRIVRGLLLYHHDHDHHDKDHHRRRRRRRRHCDRVYHRHRHRHHHRHRHYHHHHQHHQHYQHHYHHHHHHHHHHLQGIIKRFLDRFSNPLPLPSSLILLTCMISVIHSLLTRAGHLMVSRSFPNMLRKPG